MKKYQKILLIISFLYVYILMGWIGIKVLSTNYVLMVIYAIAWVIGWCCCCIGLEIN